MRDWISCLIIKSYVTLQAFINKTHRAHACVCECVCVCVCVCACMCVCVWQGGVGWGGCHTVGALQWRPVESLAPDVKRFKFVLLLNN